MKTLIVDDEAPARARLRRMLEKFPDIEVVGEAVDGIQALQKVSSLRPDVIFLDIEMPLLNGLEVAAAIGTGIRVVFATAYDEYAIQAFEQNAIDYLLKPIERPRLERSIDRLLQSQTPELDPLNRYLRKSRRISKLGVRVGQKIIAVDIDQISLLTTAGEYTEIICGQERYFADDSLTALHGRLPEEKFLRIHRSTIINVDFLQELKREGDRKYIARLSDYFASEAPISRDQLARLKTILGMG